MRVFVTGMGVLSSLGNSVEAMFQGLLENRSGVKAYPEWKQYKGLHSLVGSPVPDFDITQVVPRRARRTMSRMSEMGVAASLQALSQADHRLEGDLSRTQIIMGSTTGSPEAFEAYYKKLFERGGPEAQLSTSFFKCMNHSVPSNVAVGLGYRGPMVAPSSACSTSAHAIVVGWELIQSGFYDVVLAGGADELHYTSAAVFDILNAASRGYNDTPDRTPRPFDRGRDGLVVSEGATAVLLESEDHAKARGALPLAELLGGAYICDGSHIAQPAAPAMAETMKMALKRCWRDAKEIDYVNAHATATLIGDVEEAKAIGEAVGSTVPVSSLKGHFGHALAACGALEVIASIEMMRQQVLIPNRNLENIDPACEGINLLQETKRGEMSTIMSNNFAFGGMNVSLLLSSVEGW